METKNLVKKYGQRRVVDGLSISVGRSEIVGLLG
ncbi:MAG: LPS export ABC transporter ATP-binding protein, partial [Candidatus Omnitrophica bacterium]|nr:LPS export ABC transporter ATP-binding protein [Candidatus Omnitrophota bacterium]